MGTLANKLKTIYQKEPALVRTVIFGGLALVAAHGDWGPEFANWIDEVASVVFLGITGFTIRRKVTPTSKG